MKRIILHAVSWSFNQLIDNMPLIAETGYTEILTSPIQPHKPFNNTNDFNERYKDFWKYYQPYSFSIEDEEGFKQLCNVAHSYNIKVGADIVLRHTASDDFNPLIPHKDVDKELLNNKDFWLPSRPINNYNDRYQATYHCTGLPALNYNNYDLQNIMIEFLDNVLKYADSIRLDQAMHYALPEEGSSFFERVIKPFAKERFIYGECINISDNLIKEYSKYLYPLCHKGNAWGYQKTVRFFFSHDDELSFIRRLAMNNQAILNEWSDLVRMYDNSIYFSRKDDPITFSKEMKEINWGFRKC